MVKDRIFISGPVSSKGYTKAEGDFNESEARLNNVLPHAIIVNIFKHVEVNEEKTWKQYMVETLPLLLDCNIVYMQKGWETSKGAQIEHFVAKQLGLEIIYEE